MRSMISTIKAESNLTKMNPPPLPLPSNFSRRAQIDNCRRSSWTFHKPPQPGGLAVIYRIDSHQDGRLHVAWLSLYPSICVRAKYPSRFAIRAIIAFLGLGWLFVWSCCLAVNVLRSSYADRLPTKTCMFVRFDAAQPLQVILAEAKGRKFESGYLLLHTQSPSTRAASKLAHSGCLEPLRFYFPDIGQISKGFPSPSSRQ
ncbi:hypothetical protein K438DRAFT_516918 [Mycena galopus ATCC 62051]|nr:hypothetical protein K438DRAFT_516918 [Mycena galopus ATCC 62051]